MAAALLFDRDQVVEVENWPRQAGRLPRSAILWVDLERPRAPEIRELAEGLDLNRESAERLENEKDEDAEPYFGDFGSYLHVTAYAPSPNGEEEFAKLECLVSDRWVVTVHEQPVDVLETFRDHASGSGETGKLEGLEFLANLLDWVLDAYLEAFEDVELALEKLDERAMDGSPVRPDEALGHLVGLRGKVGSLRRALVSHRKMFLALARPELEAIASSDSAERFASLRSRLEDVVQAARDSRDSVVGSFDVLIARTEQRTNDIVKVLTLGSLLLLPGSLIAGVMGMNFKLGIFESDGYFWVVLALMLAIAAVTVIVARARRWV